MGEDDLRVLLEDRGDVDDRDFLGRGVEGLQEVAAHVELDAVGQQERAVVDLRAAGDDLDVEAAFGVGAVGDRLVEAAMFGLGEPVGAEGDLCQVGVGVGAGGRERRGQRKKGRAKHFRSSPRRWLVMPGSVVAVAGVVRAGDLGCDRRPILRPKIRPIQGRYAHYLCEWPNRPASPLDRSGPMTRGWQRSADEETRHAGQDDVEGLTPGSVRPPFAAYSHGTLVPAGADWVFTSGSWGSRWTTRSRRARRRRPTCVSRRSTRSCRRRGSSGRHGADQRLRHRPGAYGRLHGGAGPLVRGMARLPASTLVIVAGFTRPEFKVEVEVAAARLSRSLRHGDLRLTRRIAWHTSHRACGGVAQLVRAAES
jgi:hypothetical protein